MSYCKVAYCRFSTTHVTKGHLCGNCRKYGHGDAECKRQNAINNLRIYDDDVIPNNKICTVADCQNRELHTIDAHHCPVCLKRETHTINECPKNKPTERVIHNVKCPICRSDNPTVSTKKITGLTDKCCICIDNNVEILLPTCYHCCMCLACLEKFV